MHERHLSLSNGDLPSSAPRRKNLHDHNLVFICLQKGSARNREKDKELEYIGCLAVNSLAGNDLNIC